MTDQEKLKKVVEVYGIIKPNTMFMLQLEREGFFEKRKPIDKIKIKLDYTTFEENDRDEKIERIKRDKKISAAKDWLQKQDVRSLESSSKKSEVIRGKKQIVCFLRDSMGLTFKEVAKLLHKGESSIRWTYNFTKGV